MSVCKLFVILKTLLVWYIVFLYVLLVYCYLSIIKSNIAPIKMCSNQDFIFLILVYFRHQKAKKKKMWICVEDQRPYSFGAYDKHIILGDIAIWCSVLNFTCILVYLYYVFNVILLVIVYHKIWKKSPRSENMKEIEWSLFCIRMSWSKN